MVTRWDVKRRVLNARIRLDCAVTPLGQEEAMANLAKWEAVLAAAMLLPRGKHVPTCDGRWVAGRDRRNAQRRLARAIREGWPTDGIKIPTLTWRPNP